MYYVFLPAELELTKNSINYVVRMLFTLGTNSAFKLCVDSV